MLGRGESHRAPSDSFTRLLLTALDDLVENLLEELVAHIVRLNGFRV